MSENENCCAPSCCDETQPDTAAKNNTFRENVREKYAKVANAVTEDDCDAPAASCCGTSDDEAINTLISTRLGYSQAELNAVPSGADMGLGCGNPQAIAALKAGETVVDLGSGGGFDCFLASPAVGETGHVIGIDMTPDMISKARNNANTGKFSNVEFRLGEIEHLPVADNSVDVIISNCVINLSPDKGQVFKEAYRILKTGGRLAISDVVATIELPEEMRNDPLLIAGCMGNAALIDDLTNDLEAAGFRDIAIQPKDSSKEFIQDWAPGIGVENYVVAATIEAVKV
ncbi:arsenite methyltransferase [Cocleimonas sp. KMM 6892]|uniref:arsenite methyltransferase n=1 Tax=unclassified Cocleimonas TaxID=2639732 RepID=UPI002DBA8DC7|nr:MULTISPECIES: arsenite methyltransferase [unclassified Cocleimonas]MEB8431097.1 arsenite methyltransferase [Cocleimonas sp. KMM 6892]MEC4714131.1 arsenite methyltransferase [Cocleimonas sp. KMM 6895]MEC4743462.1 arsenite methyltransferase [Cocleimonas sp. KMM 6896]